MGNPFSFSLLSFSCILIHHPEYRKDPCRGNVHGDILRSLKNVKQYIFFKMALVACPSLDVKVVKLLYSVSDFFICLHSFFFPGRDWQQHNRQKLSRCSFFPAQKMYLWGQINMYWISARHAAISGVSFRKKRSQPTLSHFVDIERWQNSFLICGLDLQI